MRENLYLRIIVIELLEFSERGNSMKIHFDLQLEFIGPRFAGYKALFSLADI